MVSRTYTVLAKEGLHARPAKALVKLVKAHNSNIVIKKGENSGNAQSMLQILSLCVLYQDEILVEISGEDEEEALRELHHFFTEDIQKL